MTADSLINQLTASTYVLLALIVNLVGLAVINYLWR
jgi:hypothetical protein